MNARFTMMLVLALAGCGGGTTEPEIAIADFIVMAKGAECSEYRNRLFLIDHKNVFWDVAGNCPDRSPLHRLFGRSPNVMLCTEAGSIAGPKTTCNDESARSLFNTIIGNLDKSDLGLGSGHQVQPIAF